MRSGIWKTIVWAAAILSATAFASALHGDSQIAWPTEEGDFIARDFKFSDGQTLPEVRLHYTTLGTPQHDANGRVTNAVLILHGTNRAGRVWLIPSFAGVLFGPGQLLDASKYYLILPDQLGAGLGKSTKPSDGLRAKFPHYDYSDMVRASQVLLSQGLQVNHLHLLIGASMGCMEGFMWGESNPDDMDAMLLLSCLPVEVASRNRMVRKIMVDDIRLDPGWNNGNYTQQPYGLRAALGHLLVVGSVPSRWQKQYPTAAAADKYVNEYIEQNMKTTDANDLMYQYDASRNYDASKDLDKILAKVLLINPQEDFWNPAEIGIAEEEIKKVKNGRFVLLPLSDSYGHYTFFQAGAWQKYFAEFLRGVE
ncbi:MAG TPA: alpha/beta fold hydrolase [Candidatus Acidoferrales bacterium]|nr:alpha/beta fold hydrolase [Candidatus Acidoferrales bacterium]